MTIRPPDPTLRLAAIVESSDDAIVSKDLNGIITSWNRGAEELFGYTADEAIGQSITMVIPPDRLAEEDMVLGHIRRGERIDHFETIRRRKDGTLVPISLTVSPIRDAAGVIVGASKIARNISYRRQIEAELHELHDRLFALATASGSILGSPDSAAVAAAAIDVARDVFAADGYAVWRATPSGSWQIVRSFGISDEFASRAIPRPEGNTAPFVPFSDPLVCEDVHATTIVADMRDAYRREGIVSMIVFPLTIRGQRSGTMVFYLRQRTAFRQVDVRVGAALANLVAAALTAADLYDEQRQAREAVDDAGQSDRCHHVCKRRIRPAVLGGGRSVRARTRRPRVARDRERARIRACERGQPTQRRVSRHLIARTPHTAERRSRVRADDAHTDVVTRKGDRGLGCCGAERHVPKADH